MIFGFERSFSLISYISRPLLSILQDVFSGLTHMHFRVLESGGLYSVEQYYEVHIIGQSEIGYRI